MKIFLIPNLTRTETIRVTNGIASELSKLGAESFMETGMESHFSGLPVQYKGKEEAFSECDCIIVIGGDGSIIHAARSAVRYGKPILGVNAGRLAFMAGLEDNELNLLSDLVEGNYTIDKRFMLKTEIFSAGEKLLTDYCLNECFITNGEKQRMSEINVALNGNKFSGYLCDGIILATPTGSTAYSLSAGGPIVDPGLESIICTPVSPHSLVARSILFKPGDSISVYSEEDKELYFSNDGSRPVLIKGGDRIVISGAECTADFIRIKSENFIDILYRKLSQRR